MLGPLIPPIVYLLWTVEIEHLEHYAFGFSKLLLNMQCLHNISVEQLIFILQLLLFVDMFAYLAVVIMFVSNLMIDSLLV